MSVAAVNDDRLADVTREGELTPEDLGLNTARREVSVVIKSSLADRHDLRPPRQLFQCFEHRFVGVGRVMGMYPHGGVDVGIDLGDPDGLPRCFQVGPNVDHEADARRAGARQHLTSVAVELGKVKVGVGVEEHGRILPRV